MCAPPESDAPQALNVMVLDPALEAALGSALVQTPLGPELQLDPQLRQHFLARIEAAHDYCWREGYTGTALLVDARIRRHVRRLIERAFPRLPVISYAEVAPGYHLNIVFTLAL